MPLHEIAAGDDRPLQEVADVVARSHKILIITGAGISTSCGIPDFRSKDGLYNLIPEQGFYPTPPSSAPSTPSRKRKAYTTDDEVSPPSSQSSNISNSSRRSSGATSKLRGQDLFDSSVWKNPMSTGTFYRFIASLRQKVYSADTVPSATHKFIRTLRDGGRLMRCYTQNIDGLEARQGISMCMDLSRGKGNKRRFMKKNLEVPVPAETIDTDFDRGCEVVSLHGDLERLRCTLCQTLCEWSDDATEEFLEGQAPECEQCSHKSDKRQASGKRGLAVGTLRPNIVLYGEEHPSNTLLTPLLPFDVASEPELLIIMGTSLKVFGLQKVVRDFAKAVHAQKNGKGKVIFVNRTRPAESLWEGIIDDYVAMDCDDWVKDLKSRREDIWLRQGELDLKITKATKKRKRKSTEEGQENRPSKRTKVIVEIPKLGKTNAGEFTNIASAATVPVPTTPHALSRSWKSSKANHPNRAILSPLVQDRRPKPSPLHQSFKPRVLSEVQNASSSPQRPPFSPLTPAKFSPFTPRGTNTPSRRMEKIWSDVVSGGEIDDEGVEIAESDHEKEISDTEKSTENGPEPGLLCAMGTETQALAAETPSRSGRSKRSAAGSGASASDSAGQPGRSSEASHAVLGAAIPVQEPKTLSTTGTRQRKTVQKDSKAKVRQPQMPDMYDSTASCHLASRESLDGDQQARPESLFKSAVKNRFSWMLIGGHGLAD